MVHMHQTELLTPSQAAGELGCSRWTVVRWIKDGRLDAAKLDGATSSYLIKRSDVERLARELAA